jgi:hypothetical protein
LSGGRDQWQAVVNTEMIFRVLAPWSYSGRKITESIGNVTVRGEKMERAMGERDGQQSEHA